MRSIEPKLYPGIDYDFRPFYWTAAVNPLDAALRNVKGRQRREMVRDYYEAGHLEGLSDTLLNDSLDDVARERLSQIHPTFMGMPQGARWRTASAIHSTGFPALTTPRLGRFAGQIGVGHRIDASKRSRGQISYSTALGADRSRVSFAGALDETALNRLYLSQNLENIQPLYGSEHQAFEIAKVHFDRGVSNVVKL